MIKYIIKRLLLFIPTLFVVSFLAFMISVKSPGDPVEILSGSASPQGGSTQTRISASIKDSIRTRHGLDLPVFYFSFCSLSDCDTLYKVTSKSHRAILSQLSNQYGNWEYISKWYQCEQKFYRLQNELKPDSIYEFEKNARDSEPFNETKKNEINEAHINAINILISLPETHDEKLIRFKLDSLEKIYTATPYFQNASASLKELNECFENMVNKSSIWKVYVPAISWYGVKNQYHRWLKNLILKGEFGYSYTDKEPITTKIWTKFWISFKLILLSVLLAYLISIPIGVYSAYKKGSLFDRGISIVLFMLFSLPSFFVGMMLLYFFANPDFVVWFPESGYMDPNNYNSDWNFLQRLQAEFPFMVLPLVTYTYSSFAFISRIMRSAMLETLNQDFIRTARAKGLDEKRVIWNHAFRNSLLPIITIFVNIFPMAIGGSVIIETIFTYPGMGLGSYEAIHNYDYPSIVAIFTLSGFLTMIAYLVADILYALADPRISFYKK